MSVQDYIRALPKVELNAHLEGALQRETLLFLAEENNIAAEMKTERQFRQWVDLFDKPDYERLDEIARTTASWMRYPDDLTRAVYDFGVQLYKQNVKYAEVSVSPAIYTDNGMSFEMMLDALNDGRDRVMRAWQVRINWILTIPRDRPRKGDDISRWATSAAARKGHVVGMGTDGREDANLIGAFRKAYMVAQKKDVATVAVAGSENDIVERIQAVVQFLVPQRLLNTWQVTDEEIAFLLEHGFPLVVTPTREVRLGRIESVAEYPLKQLLQDEVAVMLATTMPTLYQTTLNDEYVAAYEQCGLTVEQIETMILNSVMHSFMPDDEKTILFAEFMSAFEALREEHLGEASEAAETE